MVSTGARMKKILLLLLPVILFLLSGVGWWLFATRQNVDILVRNGSSEFGGKALVLSLPVGTRVVLLNNLHGDIRLFKKVLSHAQKEGCISEEGILGDDCILLINGNAASTVHDDTSVLTRIATLIEHNPNKAFYLYGAAEKQRSLGHEFPDASQRFLKTLPIGLFILGEDDEQAPILIAPRDDTRFAHIACQPVTAKDPIRAVCTVGSICSFDEGPLSAAIFSEGAAPYQELHLASPLSKSVLTSFDMGEVTTAPDEAVLDERSYTR